MTIRVSRFEWDEGNLDHLEIAHPNVSLDDLEQIVLSARRYFKVREDSRGNMVYTARRGNLVAYFNIRPGGVVRIFSVREVK